MANGGLVLGKSVGPFSGRLTADLVRQYARATQDPNRSPLDGDAVPPVAVVTQIWEAQRAGFGTLVSEEVRASMTGGVHGEHDVVLHRPIMIDERLHTWVKGHGARPSGNHHLVTLHYATYDDGDALVAEQWWTTVLLNVAGHPVGAAAPEHTFREEARHHPIGDYRVDVDEEMPRRYAEVSHDWSDHHFNDEASRRSGSDRRFLHGLCTMGLCAQAIVLIVAAGDPERIQRVAVRFAAPTYVGEELVVRLYRAGEQTCVFEAEAGGATVIRNGLAELRRW